MNRNGIILALLLSLTASAEDVAWKKPYWAWGQGRTTEEASTQAIENARPIVAELRLECDESKGIVSKSYQYGTCAKSEDPMFCKYGCWSCPLYGSGTCTVDTTDKIKPGALIEALVDAKLLSGSQVVGHVKKGDRFRVVSLNGQWASLEEIDGPPVKGWIKQSEISRVP